MFCRLGVDGADDVDGDSDDVDDVAVDVAACSRGDDGPSPGVDAAAADEVADAVEATPAWDERAGPTPPPPPPPPPPTLSKGAPAKRLRISGVLGVVHEPSAPTPVALLARFTFRYILLLLLLLLLLLPVLL